MHALGPEAEAFAERVAGFLTTWDRKHRGGPGPRIAVYPAGTPDTRLSHPPGSRVLEKAHSRVVLSWPEHPAGRGDSEYASEKEIDRHV